MFEFFIHDIFKVISVVRLKDAALSLTESILQPSLIRYVLHSVPVFDLADVFRSRLHVTGADSVDINSFCLL